MPVINLSRKLEVLGNNKVMVPGCEPTSSVTSVTLSRFQQEGGLCKNAIVDLAVALENIPGSTIEFGSNFNAPRKRWLVLPPFNVHECPFPCETDWYGVLQQLASEEVPAEASYDSCNVIGQGFCPSPDFQDIPKPPTTTYFEEGQVLSALGVVTP